VATVLLEVNALSMGCMGDYVIMEDSPRLLFSSPCRYYSCDHGGQGIPHLVTSALAYARGPMCRRPVIVIRLQ